MTILYASSRGPIPVHTMPLPYAQNALKKLQRERKDASRDEEIEAIAAHVAKLQEEHLETGAVDPDPPVVIEDLNPRAVMGGNNPPAELPDGFQAIETHANDLLLEARNFADGQKVENQAQADALAKLIDRLRQAERAADEQRKKEVAPLDEQRDAIQARYNVLIAPTKNKKPGKIPLAIETLKAALAPWLLKLEQEKRAREEAARLEAEAKAKAAAEAARAADVADLEAREAAEALLEDAQAAQADANRAAKDKAHAQGETRAIGLRTVYRPVMIDRKAALLHYATARRDELVAVLQRWAEEDVRRAVRTIPGFDVREEKIL